MENCVIKFHPHQSNAWTSSTRKPDSSTSSHRNCQYHPSGPGASCLPQWVASTHRQEPQHTGPTQTPTQTPSYEQEAIPSGKRRAPVAHAVLTPPVTTAGLTAVPPVPAPAAVAPLPVSTSAPTAPPPVPVPVPTATTGGRHC